MRCGVLLIALLALTSGCASRKPASESGSRSSGGTSSTTTRTVQVRDPELERRVARLELQLIEKEAQVEELQRVLDDTRAEVVRTMARLQTAASRAEAASGMAEAEVAFQSLRLSVGQPLPVTGQVAKLIQQSTIEFNKENYGGALYLATQAKALATSYRPVGTQETLRAGETPFALPLRLKISGRGNVREGPGTGYSVAYTVEPGATVTGYSYADDWIRITDESGRSGWIFQSLVTRP